MAINPDKLAESLGLNPQTEVLNKAAFNPDEAARNLGLSSPQSTPSSFMDRLSTPGSTENALAMKASRGFSVGGLGRDLAPLIAAIPSTATDQALNRDYGDRVLAARSQMNQAEEAGKANDPVLFEIPKLGKFTAGDAVQIAASIPKTVSMTKGLESLGIGFQGQLASQGALEGLTQSKKESLPQAAVDTALGAASSWLFGNALNLVSKGAQKALGGDTLKFARQLGENEYENVDLYKKPLEALKGLKVTENPSDYKLNLETSPGEIFKLSKELKASLADPNVQGAMRSELNAQPKILQGKLDSAQASLGTQRDQIVNAIGDDLKMNGLNEKLSTFYNKAKTSGLEKNPIDAAARDDLLSQLQTFEDGLGGAVLPGKNPYLPGSRFASDKASLRDLTEFQKTLGTRIWRDKAYDSSPAVRGAATNIWGQIVDMNSALAEKPGGDPALPWINKAFKATYDMQDNLVNGATIKSMTDPQAMGAGSKFDEMLDPLNKLPVAVRERFLPDVHNYFLTDFPQTFAKAKAMLAVTGRGSANAAHQMKALAGLRELPTQAIDYAAGQLGAAAGKLQPDVGTQSVGPQIQSGLNQALKTLAPGAAGALAPFSR